MDLKLEKTEDAFFNEENGARMAQRIFSKAGAIAGFVKILAKPLQ